MAQRPNGQIRISNHVVICAYILLLVVFVRCLECGARTTQLICAWQTTYLAGSRPLCGNPVLEEGDWRLAKVGRRERRADGIRMMNVPKKEGKGPYRVIATNKKARRNYEVMDIFKAGIELLGSEVKSCRSSKINMEDGYAQAKNGQCFMHGVHIAECTSTNRYYQHEPTRPRRLLLHKREIKKLEDKVGQKGMTIVPLKIFFDDNNRLKVEIALAQGKNVRDKRDDIKARDTKRDLQRISKNTYSY